MYRVALFSSEYPPHVCGGLGAHVAGITAALTGEAHFDLYVPEKPGYLQGEPSVRIHHVPFGAGAGSHEIWSSFCRRAAAMACRDAAAPDLLHCHDWMTIEGGVRCKIASGRPLVFHVHLPQVAEVNVNLENLGLVAADLVIVNSEAVRRELMLRQLPVRRIEVLPNGVDTGLFRPPREAGREADGLLFVGRLVPQKGVDVLIRAFGVVLRRCPESRLVIAGDGELELFVKRLARESGFPDRVTMAGWRTGEELVALYQRAQVVVMPSYYEPFGIVALEAMACGCPLVASRTGGLEEVLEEGVEGYLCRVGDHLDFARRIAALLLDPERRAAMGAAARARAELFSWKTVGKGMAGLYDSLRGSPPASGRVQVGPAVWERLASGLDPATRSAWEELVEIA